MGNSHSYNRQIRILGSQADIDAMVRALDMVGLSGNERTDREVIQELIDDRGLKASLLYEGNSVYGKKVLIAEFKRILKDGSLSKMSNRFYEFLINGCGSIAHYDKCGWIGEYRDSAVELCKFCFRNEFGNNIKDYQPHWASDRRNIAEEMMGLAEAYLNKQRGSSRQSHLAI